MGVGAASPVRTGGRLLIFPYNGNGIEAADCLGQTWDLVGFVDDLPEKQGPGLGGYPVLGRAAFGKYGDASVIAVPGSPRSFRDRAQLIGSLGLGAERFARVIHPHAAVSESADLGINLLLMAGVVITSNATLGSHVCVLPNSVIHHDSAVGDWSLIGAGVTVAGGCAIGKNCYIGSGTSIRDGVRVGDGALVGLGSTVVRDVPPGATVAGNPARLLA